MTAFYLIPALTLAIAGSFELPISAATAQTAPKPSAAAPLAIYPVQTDNETTIHLVDGMPILYLESDKAAVEIVPLPFDDDGHATFGLTLYNKSTQPNEFSSNDIVLFSSDGFSMPPSLMEPR